MYRVQAEITVEMPDGTHRRCHSIRYSADNVRQLSETASRAIGNLRSELPDYLDRLQRLDVPHGPDPHT